VPDHVEDAGQAIAQLHEDHHERASAAERVFARVTATLASPLFIAATALVVLVWIGANAAAQLAGRHSLDPAPFNLLQAAASLMAVFATLLILATQRREDQIATQRERLALHLAMLNDRKLAKLISLMEEMRRDDPTLRDRLDRSRGDGRTGGAQSGAQRDGGPIAATPNAHHHIRTSEKTSNNRKKPLHPASHAPIRTPNEHAARIRPRGSANPPPATARRGPTGTRARIAGASAPHA
jgi:uncharacterized membrane protein